MTSIVCLLHQRSSPYVQEKKENLGRHVGRHFRRELRAHGSVKNGNGLGPLIYKKLFRDMGSKGERRREKKPVRKERGTSKGEKGFLRKFNENFTMALATYGGERCITPLLHYGIKYPLDQVQVESIFKKGRGGRSHHVEFPSRSRAQGEEDGENCKSLD